MLKKSIITAVVLAASSGIVCGQDLTAGATSYKKCAPCHDVGDKAKNKVGPLLNGLMGRKSGTIPGYNYSEANKSSGIVWDDAQFLDYIKDPKAKMPNTKMVFPGIKNEVEAKNLWSYIKQFDVDGNKK